MLQAQVVVTLYASGYNENKCCLHSSTQDMSDIKSLCSVFAGGFSGDGCECVVEISSRDQSLTQLHTVVATPPTAAQDPEALVEAVCECCGVELGDVVVKVFQLCGGIDGQKLAGRKAVVQH